MEFVACLKILENLQIFFCYCILSNSKLFLRYTFYNLHTTGRGFFFCVCVYACVT